MNDKFLMMVVLVGIVFALFLTGFVLRLT